MTDRSPQPSPLASIGLFAQLGPEELGRLSAYLQPHHYLQGQTIFMQGDPGDGLYLIASGGVKIVVNSPDGRVLVVNVLGPGDFFGDLALLDGEPRSADAVAYEDSQLLYLPRADFLHFLEQRPRVAVEMLAVLSRRLRRTTRQVQDVVFLDVPARLARVLAFLAEAQGTPAPGGGLTIARRLTQAELAEMAGATRESVNKWLQVFEREGHIRRASGRLTVLQPERLRQRGH